MGLTDNRSRILNIIKEYWEKEGISPTVRELCELSGLSSTSSMHNILKHLEKDGYITKRKDSPRSIVIVKK